ncbi:hypothetical protein BRYFOR_08071 [Marvinbryantia formatexigens DSM 14469]|uniref:Uncharacterized protein n=1 Tax=Marvinbryantia formatexigens DSM 14469 TaxID=478749 RepID=C6LHG0_9FIRM|nr:hypothetical protein BRYFOR_08071 [Marvinbryantia formatexigens DSM 14469]
MQYSSTLIDKSFNKCNIFVIGMKYDYTKSCGFFAGAMRTPRRKIKNG